MEIYMCTCSVTNLHGHNYEMRSGLFIVYEICTLGECRYLGIRLIHVMFSPNSEFSLIEVVEALR